MATIKILFFMQIAQSVEPSTFAAQYDIDYPVLAGAVERGIDWQAEHLISQSVRFGQAFRRSTR